MSVRSPRRGADFRPRCLDHERVVRKEPAVLWVHFPLASLPARGFKCPECGAESFLLDELAQTEGLARRLGLYGVEGEEVRTLMKTGGSVAVTLDPRWVRDILKAKPGSPVRVGRQGNRIVIRAA